MTPTPNPSGDPPALPGGSHLRPLALPAGGADPAVVIPVEDPPALSARVTPGSLLRALGRCWPVAVPVGLILAAGAGAGAWALRPDKYTSATLIRVLPASASRLLADDHRAPEGGAATIGYMRTQVALLRSRQVLTAALKDEKVRQQPILLDKDNPVEWLEKELKAEQFDGTDLIRVSLTARGDGSGLATIVNGVIDAHLAMVRDTELDAQNRLLSDLQKAYTAKEEAVRKLRQTVQTLSRDLKGGDPQVLVLKQTTLLGKQSMLERELAATDTRRRELQVRLAKFQRQLAPPAEGAPAAAPDPAVVDALVEQNLENDPHARTVLAEVVKAKEYVEALGAKAVDPANTQLAKARERLELAQKRLDAAREARRAVVVARQAASVRAAALLADQDTRAELDLLTAQRDDLQREAGKVKAEVERYGLSSVDLELQREEAARSEALVKVLYEQKERLGVELNAANRQRVVSLGRAEAATVPNPLGRAMEAGGAAAAGLLLGLIAVCFREARRNKIHHAADVARGLRLPVVGALPAAPAPSLAGAL
ncbi:MAG: hypothetical protein K2X82_18295, partial [Gemmataceae bacterium]|nr:hypothetical protein [Gemmataceae bacterium]